jgi:hypothetical protein
VALSASHCKLRLSRTFWQWLSTLANQQLTAVCTHVRVHADDKCSCTCEAGYYLTDDEDPR